MNDPIVEELHRVREEISRESGDELEEIAEAVRKQQAGKALHVRLTPNRVALEGRRSTIRASLA